MFSVPDFIPIPIFPVCLWCLMYSISALDLFLSEICTGLHLCCSQGSVCEGVSCSHLPNESQGTCASPSFSTFTSRGSSEGQATVAKSPPIIGSRLYNRKRRVTFLLHRFRNFMALGHPE